ncbi:MAG TPA: hypothetical protein DET40_19440 [Lentisphaeria bacterium]|nr:MAG: hypothetical protein A2X45_18270 [Lentisphaerae bacterium GWF2_50_93]HCE45722.1 hypothetical protein [Lentisphaeria bacterium]
MVGTFGCEEAMLSHRRAQTGGLNAKRLTPQSGHASFRAAFILPGNNDTTVSPYSRQAESASKTDMILFHLSRDDW